MADAKQRKRAVVLGLLGLGGFGLLVSLLVDGDEEPTGPKPSDPKPGDPKPGKPMQWGRKPGSGGGGGEPKRVPDEPDEPTPPPPKPPTTPAKPGGFKPPSEPKPPPDEPDDPSLPEIVVTYPRGGAFYQVLEDDVFLGTDSDHSIAYRYLLSEGYLAAIESGASPDEATEFARRVANDNGHRLSVMHAIQCGGFNDAAYGTYGYTYEPGGGPSIPSAHGRAIRLVPQHAPNLDLLEAGDQASRNIRIKTLADKGKGNAFGFLPGWRSFELLWLPAIDRAKLWASGGATLDFGVFWNDGLSMQNPPAWVLARGIGDPAGDLSGSSGCPGGDGELEVG